MGGRQRSVGDTPPRTLNVYANNIVGRTSDGLLHKSNERHEIEGQNARLRKARAESYKNIENRATQREKNDMFMIKKKTDGRNVPRRESTHQVRLAAVAPEAPHSISRLGAGDPVLIFATKVLITIPP